MSSRQGLRGERNSGGDRDDRGDRYGSGRDQHRDGARKRDENERGGERREGRYAEFGSNLKIMDTSQE